MTVLWQLRCNNRDGTLTILTGTAHLMCRRPSSVQLVPKPVCVWFGPSTAGYQKQLHVRKTRKCTIIIYKNIISRLCSIIYIQRYTTARHTSNERADHGCTGTTHYNSLIRTTLSHRHNKDRTWSYLTESGAGGLGASYLLVTLPLLPADAAAAGGRHRELCNKNRTRRRRHGRRSRVAYPGYMVE